MYLFIFPPHFPRWLSTGILQAFLGLHDMAIASAVILLLRTNELENGLRLASAWLPSLLRRPAVTLTFDLWPLESNQVISESGHQMNIPANFIEIAQAVHVISWLQNLSTNAADSVRAQCLQRQWHGWLRGTVVRTLVFDRRTFAVPCSTCSWRVTTYVGKTSATGQPTRPTQPFILSGSINWVVSYFVGCVPVAPSGECSRG